MVIFEGVTVADYKMKKSKQKDGRGGARLGAGGGCRWKHGQTKVVRLPVALLDEILEVARYMDEHDGKLPFSAPHIVTSGHPPHRLSAEELKEHFARQKAHSSARAVMAGDDRVLVNDKTFAALP